MAEQQQQKNPPAKKPPALPAWRHALEDELVAGYARRFYGHLKANDPVGFKGLVERQMLADHVIAHAHTAATTFRRERSGNVPTAEADKTAWGRIAPDNGEDAGPLPLSLQRGFKELVAVFETKGDGQFFLDKKPTEPAKK
jgi:hypothetical protein